MSATPSQIAKRLFDATFKERWADSFRRMFFYKTVRVGRLVGKDQFGNEFYEAPAGSMELRERWIEFAGKKSELNAMRIAPEWHSWLTHLTTKPPTQTPFEQPHYLLAYKPTGLSNMAQNANFVPCHYFNKPIDIKPIEYPKVKYTTWNPTKAV